MLAAHNHVKTAWQMAHQHCVSHQQPILSESSAWHPVVGIKERTEGLTATTLRAATVSSVKTRIRVHSVSTRLPSQIGSPALFLCLLLYSLQTCNPVLMMPYDWLLDSANHYGSQETLPLNKHKAHCTGRAHKWDCQLLALVNLHSMCQHMHAAHYGAMLSPLARMESPLNVPTEAAQEICLTVVSVYIYIYMCAVIGRAPEPNSTGL